MLHVEAFDNAHLDGLAVRMQEEFARWRNLDSGNMDKSGHRRRSQRPAHRFGAVVKFVGYYLAYVHVQVRVVSTD